MTPDLRLWNHLYCLAFDDVARELCERDATGGPEGRRPAALLRRLVDPRPADANAVAALDRLLRGTLFLRFGERVLYWLDRLPEVEDAYQRRIDVLRGRRLTARELRSHADRGE